MGKCFVLELKFIHMKAFGVKYNRRIANPCIRKYSFAVMIFISILTLSLATNIFYHIYDVVQEFNICMSQHVDGWDVPMRIMAEGVRAVVQDVAGY